MALPFAGYKGTIKVGATPIELDFVGAWTFEAKREVKKTGPYITSTSTGIQTKVVTALDGSGSLDGDVLVGANTGRAALRDALINNTTLDIVLTQTSGEIITLTNAIISGLKIDNKGDDVAKISFDFEANGSIAIADAP